MNHKAVALNRTKAQLSKCSARKHCVLLTSQGSSKSPLDTISTQPNYHWGRLEFTILLGKVTVLGWWGLLMRGPHRTCDYIQTHPKGPSTQYSRTLVPKAIKGIGFGTRVLKYWVLGPSDSHMYRRIHVCSCRTCVTASRHVDLSVCMRAYM